MSDSFADLWNSTTPSNNTQSQPKPTLATPQATVKRPQYDAFSILSSTSANTSRPASGQSSTPSTRGLTSVSARPQPSATSSKSSDAFSELFSNSSQSKMQNMTMAERAAAARAEQQKQTMNTYHNSAASSSAANNAWAGLDTLASTGSGAASASHNDFGLKPTPGPTIANPIFASGSFDDNDDWGLGNEFNATSATSRSPAPALPPSQKPTSGNIWDELDEFTSQNSKADGSRNSPSNDFDFGNREDSYGASAHDDILGDLAKPVEDLRRASPAATTPSPQPQPRTRAPSSRSTSPPPHILGQLIEMGFSIPEAKAALASTDTGIDVQAAAEMLLSSGAGSGQASSPPGRERPQTQRVDSSTGRSQRERPQERDTDSPSAVAAIQADKLIAQASEIGMSLFKNAGSLWKESREKVQKAYIERVNSDASGSGRVNNGRPKWMTEQHSGEPDEPRWKQSETENAPEPRSRPAPAASASPSTTPVAKNTKPVDLFSSFEDSPSPVPDEPRIYIPKSRRPNATSSRASPAPVRKRTRPVVTASPGAIANSNKHKTVGGEKFKLGQYGDAEQAYSLAIDILPRNHLLLVPLYNNRALTRLKNGEYKGAEGDATSVISIIGEDWRQGIEEEVTVPEHGAGVDLGDGLVKAWRRRAEALEGREQWNGAMKDWEKVAGAAWTNQRMRTDGAQGAGRCRRALNPEPQAKRATPAKPVASKARARPPVSTAPSQALDNLRKVNEAADAEDQAKHELKDQVDAKLVGWKGGKETNIRALLASLDSVLWPELGMQKSNMADLLSPNQVKIRYTKAIAKLHPDKLNANNSTVEQRMIAQGVFGALNEAWNAFKP